MNAMVRVIENKLASVMGNMELDTLPTNEDISSIKNAIEVAHSKGLEYQVICLQEKLLANCLATKDMLLMEVWFDPNDNNDIWEIMFDRQKKVSVYGLDGEMGRLSGRFREIPLRKFTGSIPEHIINKIPKHLVEKARVLKRVNAPDPIIVIPIGQMRKGFNQKKYWIGIYQWD